MLKFIGTPVITFAEFPDEIALCFNISGCPNCCQGCSEPELREYVGEDLTLDVIKEQLKLHSGVTIIGFLGGDRDHNYLKNLILKIKEERPDLRIGFYSGRNYLNLELVNLVDYYKIGEFRMFKGEYETWKDQTAGPICLPTSNQVMFKRVDGQLVNITDKFRKNKINNWKTVIL